MSLLAFSVQNVRTQVQYVLEVHYMITLYSRLLYVQVPKSKQS